MNWSLVIAVAALLVSVLSPALTSLINNSHSARMERIRFELEHRSAAIEKYLRFAGVACGYCIAENLAQYFSCCGEVYLYLPQNLWHFVDEISSALREKDTRTAQLSLHALGKALSDAGLAPKFR